ncbi:hypothetical protein [Burkholderia sp. Bp8963]|uniref:hypothetical protein n=1 Tax=Burkholderia sp. Bp8963 TaxID=2184547 RepID=UPI000F5ADF7B|nr:hypothetical protein [Burkholderia sp. Bp8963]
MRIARLLHDAAVRQPRPGTAPALSLVTLVLVFGGYVTLDKVCKADPVCRAKQVSGPQMVIVDMPSSADLAAMVGDPSTLLPLAVPFRLPDYDLLAAPGDGDPSVDPDMDRAGEPKETVNTRRATALSRPADVPRVTVQNKPADAPRVMALNKPADAPRVTGLSKPVDALATRPCANRSAPGCVRPHGGAIRVAELQRTHEQTRHERAVRNSSTHGAALQRSPSNHIDVAKLYRGH